MSPYAAGAAALLLVASHAGVWHVAHQAGADEISAKQAKEEDIRRQTLEVAQQGAAAAIAANRPRNVTIRQETEREIQTRTVYADCRHSPDQLQRINEALTGRPISAGGGELPGSGAAQ